MAKPLANQEIRPTREELDRGPRLVEPVPPRTALPADEQSAAEKVTEWKEAVGEKIEDLKQRSAEKLSDVRESASETYEQAKAKAVRTIEDVKATSAEMAEHARVRARGVVENYPLHVLAAVFGLAFAAGLMLRIWRSSRYE
jgi:hypothetical protein